MEWIHYSALVTPVGVHSHCCFLLPMQILEGNDPIVGVPLVCRSVMMQVTGKGRTYWQTCAMAVTEGTIPLHRLTGKRNCSRFFKELVRDDLHLFLDDLKEHAEPVATWMVREKMGKLHVHDADDKKLMLAPSWSKRKLYGRFAYGRGWIIKMNNQGCVEKKCRQDDQWKDNEPLPICSWGQFWRYRQQEFLDLVIRKPTSVTSATSSLISLSMAREMPTPLRTLPASTAATTAAMTVATMAMMMMTMMTSFHRSPT